jgi:hypothetical protein
MLGATGRRRPAQRLRLWKLAARHSGGIVTEAERRFAGASQLAGVVREVFGADRSIAGVDRLAGGTKKGVYRVALDDRSSAVVYVWNAEEDYWDGLLPDSSHDPESVFAHSSGIDLFEAATRRLAAVGARSPRLLFTDRSHRLYPGEIAVAEDVAGGTLQSLLDTDPDAGRATLGQLAEMVRAMHQYRAPAFGKVAFADGGGVSKGGTCEAAHLEHALVNIADAAARDVRGWRTSSVRSARRSSRARSSGWCTASSAPSTPWSARTANRS